MNDNSQRTAMEFRRCSLTFLLVAAVLAAFGAERIPAQDTPTLTVNDECVAFAYAPDGRIAYATRHIMKTKRWEIERDDFWLMEADGKRRRIVNGEKLVQSPVPYSYAVQSLRWAPDGTKLTAELFTSQITDERGNTEEGVLTLLLDENGKEIKIARNDSVIPNAVNAAWLGDGASVAYLQEAVKPKLLYGIALIRPVAGRGSRLFPDNFFVTVAWNARQNSAVAIERDRALSGPPRLVALDLIKESRRELATLDGYVGGLSLSPSGAKIAYFREPEVLEIREVAQPERSARARVAMGNYEWAPDERRILLKRGPAKRSGDLVWVTLPPTTASPTRADATLPEATLAPILHGLTFRAFEISPDGRFVAVTRPGDRNLLIYPLQ